MNSSINRLLEWILVIIMFVMVLAVLWQVFSRYILQNPSSFTEELVRFLLIWVGTLGAAYASGKRLHLAIDLLPSKLNEQSRKKLLRFIDFLVMSFAALVLVVGGSNLVYITFILEQNSPALGIPLATVYTVLPISGVIIIWFKLRSIITPDV